MYIVYLCIMYFLCTSQFSLQIFWFQSGSKQRLNDIYEVSLCKNIKKQRCRNFTYIFNNVNYIYILYIVFFFYNINTYIHFTLSLKLYLIFIHTYECLSWSLLHKLTLKFQNKMKAKYELFNSIIILLFLSTATQQLDAGTEDEIYFWKI